MPKQNIDYSKIIIYKIVCKDLAITDLYVGSTSNWYIRKSEHKNNCKNLLGRKIYKTINDNGGWENWEMLEIEKYPCCDSNEARARERYWMEELNAKLNMIKPLLTSEEKSKYYENNKDYYKERYNTNKERIKEFYEKIKDNISNPKEWIKNYNKKNYTKEKKNKDSKLSNNYYTEYYEKNREKFALYNKKKYEERKLKQIEENKIKDININN